MKALRAGMLALPAGVLLFAAQSSNAQNALGISYTQRAGDFREQVGKRLTFVCPASEGAKANVYGTDQYTEDSPICAAAIHAGVLKPARAGAVTILIGTGAKSFRGSERNGVVSRDYGAWHYSYAFERDGEPGTISWRTIWGQLPADFAEPVALACPAAGNPGAPVWGTDIYQRDSAICVAAVHAGMISAEKGGSVAVRRVPGPRGGFAGTERFMVSSKTWSAQPDAFAVTVASKPAAGSSAPPPNTGIAITGALPAGTANAAYVGSLGVTGGSGVGLVWSIHAGSLPPGLALARAGGPSAEITGTPMIDGAFNFTVRVEDSTGQHADKVLGVTVAAAAQPPPPPTIALRTIQLAGFTVVGDALPGAAGIAPRTIQLAGFTVTGAPLPSSTANVAPRTITTSGWIVVGSPGIP